MRSISPTPEEMVASAVAAATSGGDLHSALDQLPAAVYVTDREGIVTHYNSACIALAGRTPTLRHDKWCVTWRLYTSDGDFLPHDQCPMAVAIREQREVRGVEAIAERPDGTRVRFAPYPTPLFDDEGMLIGAVNLLIDVSQLRHAAYLRTQASRCRRLAASLGDDHACATLRSMAAEYEEQAAQIDRPN